MNGGSSAEETIEPFRLSSKRVTKKSLSSAPGFTGHRCERGVRGEEIWYVGCPWAFHSMHWTPFCHGGQPHTEGWISFHTQLSPQGFRSALAWTDGSAKRNSSPVEQCVAGADIISREQRLTTALLLYMLGQFGSRYNGLGKNPLGQTVLTERYVSIKYKWADLWDQWLLRCVC